MRSLPAPPWIRMSRNVPEVVVEWPAPSVTVMPALLWRTKMLSLPGVPVMRSSVPPLTGAVVIVRPADISRRGSRASARAGVTGRRVRGRCNIAPPPNNGRRLLHIPAATRCIGLGVRRHNRNDRQQWRSRPPTCDKNRGRREGGRPRPHQRKTRPGADHRAAPFICVIGRCVTENEVFPTARDLYGSLSPLGERVRVRGKTLNKGMREFAQHYFHVLPPTPALSPQGERGGWRG